MSRPGTGGTAAAPLPRRALRTTALAALVALASAAAMGLGGCASSAGIGSSAQPLSPAGVGLDPAAGASDAAALSSTWWTAHRDPALDALIERALTANPGLKVAQARIVRAAAAVAGARAAEAPQADASASAQSQRFSANAVYPPPVGGSTFLLANARLGGAWELDFFGRHRAAIESAIGSQRAAAAELQAARSLLSSQVASAYVQLARLFAQRELAAQALQQREQTLSLIRQRVQAGLDTHVELRQGEAALPDSRLQIAQIDEQIGLARHALAALTAQPPAALDGLVASLPALRPLLLPTALPADLLARRADVAAARWRAEAAAGEVRVARAAFYPNVNLGAFIGLSSIGLGDLLRKGSLEYGVGPALHLPVFDAGRLRAQLGGRTAELDAAIETYNSTVINAVHEAADQFASLQSLARQQAEQALAQAAAASAHDLALQRFRAGLANYLVVLSAEGQVLAQRRQGVDLAARVLDTQVALVRALGGGYRDDTAAPARAAS